MKTLLHTKTQQAIVDACSALGIPAEMEYRGKGYVADVMSFANGKKYAFEVQVSPQSLKRTEERQQKYLLDNAIACWLFEKEPARQREELEHLPIFRIIEQANGLNVSLKGRKTLPLDVFVKDFIGGKIKFCHTLNPLPIVNVNFIEMRCWKCNTLNHIYYITPFHSSCNTEIINQDEQLWANKKFAFHPEIIRHIRQYQQTEKGRRLVIGDIRQRYSRTTGTSYMSFGCAKCDSIFGDWYVMEAMLDTWYGDGVVDSCSFNVDFDLNMRQDIPHWCHPGEHNFCE